MGEQIARADLYNRYTVNKQTQRGETALIWRCGQVQAEPDRGEEVDGRVREALKRGRAGWRQKAQRGSSWEPAATSCVSAEGPEREEREERRTAGQTTGSADRRSDSKSQLCHLPLIHSWKNYVTFSVSGHPSVQWGKSWPQTAFERVSWANSSSVPLTVTWLQ